ncbi:MAG: NAD(P)/FAD-dependent oxidoreductase [Myxococcales bacterium]|nr:NAD(P)/FAD-dependent oxidoreductase [Myxococcales bacterium]
MQDSRPHGRRVVIVGGGFGGLAAARALRRAPVEVTLVDRRNFHLFQPLLYQVATGGLSPANIATPFRWAFRRQRNIDVVLGEVTGFDVAGQRVLLGGDTLAYDQLVVAAGATHSYFGQDWAALAPGLKTIEDATEIRSRVLLAFERADRTTDADTRRALLTFVIVGAGPTGVELAGALSEIAHHTLRHEFRHVDPSEARICLVDAVDRVLSAFPETLSARAVESLAQLDVEVLTSAKVVRLEPGRVELEVRGAAQTIACETVLWAAGVRASPLGEALAAQTGAKIDRAGRLEVGPDCTLPGHPEISVIGDLASFAHGRERPLPGVAPVAMQQGRYVARRIGATRTGGTPHPFRYRDRGTLATIGRARAVADFGGLRISGLPAWLLWLFVHVMNLTQAESRILVLVQWAFSYATYNRSARLITKDGRGASQDE